MGDKDKVKAIAEHRRLSELHMSEATRHFHCLANEKEANSVADKINDMPTAIQHFILAHRVVVDKKSAEIRAMHNNPPEMAPGQAYFTKIMRAERERKAAEIKALKENPPPASA